MQYLKEKFKSDKCKSYRSIPFWSWNDKLTPEGLKKQIRWMNDKGIGGFFMHARSGLQTEYLSEEWMECIEACADEAERLGMKLGHTMRTDGRAVLPVVNFWMTKQTVTNIFYIQ